MQLLNVTTRRQFLTNASKAIAGGMVLATGQSSWAAPFGLPPGLQLYSVREMLQKDYEGTLRKVAALGYREVEAAGFWDHTPTQVKAAMSSAGLNCVSAHYSFVNLNKSFDQTVSFCHDIGVRYLICSSPGIKDPSQGKDHVFTPEDARWNAERFNEWGRKVKAAGMQFGYHNHTIEFGRQGGVVPFDEMVRLTDKELVTFELDCGWVVVGGANPAEYVRRFADRISMLQVKDFKPADKRVSANDPPPASVLGRGTIDYRPIFAAAKGAHLRHIFVEQEEYDMPPFEALKIDLDYMQSLPA